MGATLELSNHSFAIQGTSKVVRKCTCEELMLYVDLRCLGGRDCSSGRPIMARRNGFRAELIERFYSFKVVADYVILSRVCGGCSVERGIYGGICASYVS
jgi:hypothetical protein